MAVRTVSVAGGNYNSTATWVELAVPTSADDVVFTATSGNLTVNVASAAKTFICTNWVGTLAMNATLTVSGTVTFVTGITITGTSNLILNTTCTLTSGGKIFTGGLQFETSSKTYTLADNWTIAGSLTNNGSVTFINSFNIYVGGGFNINVSLYGTTIIILNGTGTWIGGGDNTIAVTIDTAGTITISGTILHRSGTFTYTTGTVVVTGSTLNITGTVTHTYTNSMSWNNVTSGGSLTANGADMGVKGNLSLGSGSYGTSTILLNGTGTWSASVDNTRPVTINTTGTITISGTINHRFGTFTYIAGTVVTTGSTLSLSQNATTLNTNGINWNNVTLSDNFTYTLNSLLTVNGTLSLQGSITFAGTSGFTCHTFSATTAGATINFLVGKTYTVTNSLVVTGTSASRVSFVSTSTRAFFNLQAGATQNVQNCNATLIDSSGGQTITTSAGTLTNTINWLVAVKGGFIAFFMS